MPESLRFTNVGSTGLTNGVIFRFDLVVTVRGSYTPADASLNGLNGRFANINVAAGTCVDLRVQPFPSCSTLTNCVECDRSATPNERIACYARGCSCFAEECTTIACCSGELRAYKRRTYNCLQMDVPFTFPGAALIGMSVFDVR